MKIEQIFTAVNEGDLIVLSYTDTYDNEAFTLKMRVLFKSKYLIGISQYINRFEEPNINSNTLLTLDSAGLIDQFKLVRWLDIVSDKRYYSNCVWSIEKAN